MFRTLLPHPQEKLHKRHLVYQEVLQKQHLVYILSAVCVAPPEDEQVILETCRGP
jgi:hypothetical protein